MQRGCPALSETPNVIKAIDGELDYIESLSDMGRADEKDAGVAGQLVTLNVYLQKAQALYCDHAGDRPALDVIRKIAATAIRALIMYGCPERAEAPKRPIEPEIVLLREDRDPSTLRR